MVRLKGRIEDHITEVLVFRVAAKYVREHRRRAASYLGWAIHAHDRDLYNTLKRRLTHAR